MNPLTRGVRNAFRNSIRTFSIVVILGASIALALIMLLARQAVEGKIDSVKSSVGNTISVAPAGARGFDGGGNPLTTDQMKQVSDLAHVTSITESLNDRLNATDTTLQSAIDAGSIGQRSQSTQQNDMPVRSGAANGNRTFTPPIIVVGTNNATDLQSYASDVKITSGQSFDPSKDANVAMIGKALADKNGLKVGSSFTAYGTSVTVVGIFDTGTANRFATNLVVMPLPTVQRLSSQSGAVSSAIVHIDSIENLASATSAISSKLGSAADVTSSEDSTKQVIDPLESIKSTTMISLIGALAAGSAVILLTMLMIVRERRREVGVLKAIGATSTKIMAQFMAEAVTLTLLASVIGLGLGIAGANPITKTLVNSSTSNSQTATNGAGMMRAGGFRRGVFAAPGQVKRIGTLNVAIGWPVVVYGVAVALVIAILGSVIPAWLIAKIRPAEVMRAE
ncbi:MAG TPA: FtsX-like permease family protein [Candidatus Saccharimonadales bacterium]|nr:FtsX-like permease family protein [Candidatus Saccharimonadales bacterium]